MQADHYLYRPMTAQSLELKPGEKVYFASDFHFGIPDHNTSVEREKRVCSWLDSIRMDARRIYLLGDLFDAWMEYSRVVPKGHVRFLGKLAELRDAGIEVIVFTGNHDLWMQGYFEREFAIPVFKDTAVHVLAGKRFVLGHGDGVSAREKRYRFLRAVLHHPWCQWLYRKLHPDWGVALADYFSRLGPKHKYANLQLKPLEQEYQVDFARSYLQQNSCDYFVFGHRHIPMDIEVGEKARLINVGDWLSFNSYAVFDGSELLLKKY